MKPHKSILDPSFAWTSSARTDLKKTFARIRREQRANQIEAQAKVAPLKQQRKTA